MSGEHEKAPEVALQGPKDENETATNFDEDTGLRSECQVLVTHWKDVDGFQKKDGFLPWGKFCAWLKSVKAQAEKHSSPLVKLARFGDKRSAKGSLRHDANVLEVYGIEGDVDGGLSFDKALGFLDQANIRSVVATTHSHTPEEPHLRIFCPLAAPCSPAERKHYVARLNGALDGYLAHESFKLSQSFFVGPHPEGEYRVEAPFDDLEDGYCIDDLPELDKIAIYGEANLSDPEQPEIGEINETLQAAHDVGLDPEHLGGGKWALLCPWRHEHTKETVKSSASYFEPYTNGYKGEGFKCLHAHCAERGIADFREALGLASRLSEEAEMLAQYAEMGQRGAAELFEEMFRGKFVFDHTTGEWFEFAGHFWQRDKTGNRRKQGMDEIQRRFEQAETELAKQITTLEQQIRKANKSEKEELKGQKHQLEKQQTAISKLCGNLNKLAFRKQVEEFAAQGEGSLGIGGDEWDRLPWSLPVLNGVIDLQAGSLREGHPEDYLRSHVPTRFNPDATAPQWERAVNEIMGEDQELVAFLQRVFGMALVGEVIEHKLIVLYGSGRNGKDTILETLGHVLGEHIAGAIQSEMLLEQGGSKSSSGPSADVMRLRGLRIGWASETNEGRRLNVSKVKQLTGGGAIVGRAPYARYEVSFPQTHTLFLLTNAKPHAPPEDFALWKRLVLIPFTQSFVEEPQEPHEREVDKDILGKLREEAEGVLAWLVRGCLEWQRQGLNPPQVVKSAVREYQREEDTILQFVEEACVQGPECKAPANQLYQEYRKWAENGGMRPMGKTRFGRRISSLFRKSRENRGVFYEGVGVLSE